MGEGLEGFLAGRGVWPSPERLVAVVGAGGAARGGVAVGLQQLSGRWCEEGERACGRVLRVLRGAGLARVVLLMGEGVEGALSGLYGREARLGRGEGLEAGLRLGLSAGAGVEAVLWWPVEAALVSEGTLSALLGAGPEGLEGRAWVRAPALGHGEGEEGLPWLISAEAARRALGARDVEAALRQEALWQRVVVGDRFIKVRLGGVAQSWPWLSEAGRAEM